MKTKRKRLKIFALVLIAVGLVLFGVSAYLEAQHFPWGRFFGTASQDAESVPDPSPIQLDPEDAEASVTMEFDPSPSVLPAPTETPPPSAGAGLPGDENATKQAPAVTKYVVIGVLKIPVLKVSQNVLEGAGKQMKYGVGHVPSTAGIGQKGNCAIAGHRPYPFRYLDQLKSGDKIDIKVGKVQYTYTVYDSFAVLPNEVWVLDSIKGEEYTLTLITCTPYLVSSHRLIIRARLTDINGMTPQAYYGETAAPSPSDTAAPPPSDAAAPPPAATAQPEETALPSPTSQLPVPAPETPAETASGNPPAGTEDGPTDTAAATTEAPAATQPPAVT